LDFGKGIFGDQSFPLRRIEELPGYSAAFASGVVAELATTITSEGGLFTHCQPNSPFIVITVQSLQQSCSLKQSTTTAHYRFR
jgi:hypothetical protein